MGQNGHQSVQSYHTPEFIIPAIRIVNPDGSVLTKPGKPVAIQEMVGTTEAARLLGTSVRWVQMECESGQFLSAYRPGRGSRAWWKIARAEVLSRLVPD